MKSKRTYQAARVQHVRVAALLPLLVTGCIVALDVAKQKFVVALATLTGEVIKLFRFEHPTETRAFLEVVASLRSGLEPGTLKVAMEPTGVLEVSVRSHDGSPLADAYVATSPNVFWIGVGSTIFPWREWYAITDATGLARIEDLPSDDGLFVFVGHDSYRMKRAERDRSPRVPIHSGQTASLEIELEAAD